MKHATSQNAVIVGCLIALAAVAYAATIPVSITYEFQGQKPIPPGTPVISATGINSLCIPHIPETGLDTVSDLFHDIEDNDTYEVVSISRYVQPSDALQTYTGTGASNNFSLVPGEGYLVQVNEPATEFNYAITGDHDTSAGVTLYEEDDFVPHPDPPPTYEGQSKSGIQDYCPPYHADGLKAEDLWQQIEAAGGEVLSISRFIISTDTFESYTGASTNFDIEEGKSYRVQVGAQVDLVLEELYVCQDETRIRDEIANYLEVNAFQGVPGCLSFAGDALTRFDNLTESIHFQVDTLTEWEVNDSEGTRKECADQGETCADGTCVTTDDCDLCDECFCCVDKVVNVPPGSGEDDGTKVSCGFPHCDADPSCDNVCDTVNPNDCSNGEYSCSELNEDSVKYDLISWKCNVGDSWSTFSPLIELAYEYLHHPEANEDYCCPAGVECETCTTCIGE